MKELNKRKDRNEYNDSNIDCLSLQQTLEAADLYFLLTSTKYYFVFEFYFN